MLLFAYNYVLLAYQPHYCLIFLLYLQTMNAILTFLVILILLFLNNTDICVNGGVGNGAVFKSLAQIEILWHVEIKLVSLLEIIIRKSKRRHHYVEM